MSSKIFRCAILMWTCFPAFSFILPSPKLTKIGMYGMPQKGGTFCVAAFTELSSNSTRSDLVLHTRQLDNEISAREWMENIEQSDGSIYGVGAYTVLRCDFENFNQWNVWGVDFHMDRLCTSYKMLLESQSLFRSTINASLSFKKLRHETDEVITRLLEEASRSLHREASSTQSDSTNTVKTEDNDGMLHRTLMLTILWTPPKHQSITETIESEIRATVRGHAAFAGPFRSSMEDQMSPAISVCLALPDELTPEAFTLLPRRYVECTAAASPTLVALFPSAKISMWCSARRPLEDPTRFKVPEMNVGEVLLVNQCNNTYGFIESLEILEGLTSNLFVVYKDGTVRTAPASKVLEGYSRHLVMTALLEMEPSVASSAKLVLDERAPTVKDAMEGLWSEVFVTSAIRLLIPVNRVLIPSTKDSKTGVNAEMSTLWQGEGFVHMSAIRRMLFM